MNATDSRHHLLFDGNCAFCRHSVKWLRRLDWRGVLSFVNLRDETDPIVLSVPVSSERLAEEMHVWPANQSKVYHGFGAFRWLCWRLPMLWPIAPLLYLPLVPWVGQAVYLWVARNRFSLVPCRDGVCTIQRKNVKEPRTQ